MPRHKHYVRRPPLIRYVRPVFNIARKIARKTAAYSGSIMFNRDSTTMIPKIKKIRKLTIASRRSLRIASLPERKPTPLIVFPQKKIANKKKTKKKDLQPEYLPKKTVKLLNELVNFNKSIKKTLSNIKNGKKAPPVNQTLAINAQERVTRSNSIFNRRTRSYILNNTKSRPKSLLKAVEKKKIKDNNESDKKNKNTSRSAKSKSKGKTKTANNSHEEVAIQLNIPQLSQHWREISGQQRNSKSINSKLAKKRKSIFSRKKKTGSSHIFYIINKERLSHEWQFKTLSKSCLISNTIISMKSHCDCSEYHSKKYTCQHIQFFLKSVANLPIIFDELNQKKQIIEQSYHKLDDALKRRLFERYCKTDLNLERKANFEQVTGGKCIICFNLLNQNTEQNEECQKCCGIFHSSCLEIWKRYHNSCVFCQSPLQFAQLSIEPIKEFSELTI